MNAIPNHIPQHLAHCVRTHLIATGKEKPTSKPKHGSSKTTPECAKEMLALIEKMPEVFSTKQLMEEARRQGLRGYSSTNSSYVIRRIRALAPEGTLKEFKLGRESVFRKSEPDKKELEA